MRQYLLDSAPLAALLNNRPLAVARFTPWMMQRLVATSIVVYGEVNEYLYGLPDYRSANRTLRTLLRGVTPIDLTYSILNRYGQIRRALRSPYGPGLIGDIDTLIAATALERDLTVVTCDRHFDRIPGLKFEYIDRNRFRS